MVFHGSRKSPAFVELRLGGSSSATVAILYYRNQKLIMVKRQRLEYPTEANGNVVYKKMAEPAALTVVAEERLYFDDGKLFYYVATGDTELFGEERACGDNELPLSDHLLAHWDAKEMDLESWLKYGTFPD